MGCVLIALPKVDDGNRIAGIIRKSGTVDEVVICSSGAAVLREAHARNSGAVICTKNLRDMGYADLSGYLPECFGMVIITGDASLELFSERMLRVVTPIKSRELIATVETVLSGFQIGRKKKKVGPVKRSPEEQLIIDQAKEVLMQQKDMTEPEAFRYIQKNSMDAGRTMLESAQMILLLNSDWSS